MVEIKITREDIESGKPHSCTECPLARALKRSYEASYVNVNYSNFNKGSDEKPEWVYRGYAQLRWDEPLKHKTWKFENLKGPTAMVMIALPKLMTKWATDYDRIGNARGVTFRMKWHPQQR